MRANELRIGNWVYSNLTNINFQVNALDIVNIDRDGTVAKPIELNKYWLLKFGFEKIDHVHGYSFYTLSNSKKNKCHIDIHDRMTKYRGAMIDHCYNVHQLQNLYFALTGKELES